MAGGVLRSGSRQEEPLEWVGVPGGKGGVGVHGGRGLEVGLPTGEVLAVGWGPQQEGL